MLGLAGVLIVGSAALSKCTVAPPPTVSKLVVTIHDNSFELNPTSGPAGPWDVTVVDARMGLSPGSVAAQIYVTPYVPLYTVDAGQTKRFLLCAHTWLVRVQANGQAVGTAEDYGQQAADLAQSGAAANASPDDEWMPLGVFAMVRNEQQHPQMIFQLAINKNGVLAGNFTDEVTEHTRPISGAADPKTQRAAWTVGDNKNVIVEAGLSNLAEGEAPALIHKNGKTDHWLLVRLTQPADNKPTSDAAPGTK